MSLQATRAGLVAARRNLPLVATLWLVNLALSTTAALPLWQALADAIGPLPGADALAQGLSFGILADLAEMRPGLVPGFFSAAGALFVLGLAVGAAAAGGALEVLTSTDPRPFAHRFGRGLRFFGRFLRMGAITLVATALAAAVTAGPLFALYGRLRRESGSEWLSLATLVAALAVAGLVLLLGLLVQDAARIRLVREDARRVRGALRAGLRLVLGRSRAWLGVWAANALLLLLAFGAYLALSDTAAPVAWLAVLVALQQAFVLVRCALRVALLGAELALVPPPAPAPLAAAGRWDQPVPEPPLEPPLAPA